jgi:hypothetical protein
VLVPFLHDHTVSSNGDVLTRSRLTKLTTLCRHRGWAEALVNRDHVRRRSGDEMLPASSAQSGVGAMTENAPYPGLDEHSAIEFLMATNDGTAIDGWHWLIEWTTTSFYIKSMNPAIQAMKVSMHGPDPRPQHRGREHFRFDLERTNRDRAARAVAAGARWLSDPSELPHYFEGRKVNDNVKLLVRFSVGHDAYVAGAPAAGGSDWPVQDAMKGIVPLPLEGRVRHVDIFLSDDGSPYWPNEDKVRATRSGLGYIRNSLNWCLSAVVFDRRFDDEPDPCGDLRGDTPVSQCSRGLASTVDETSLLWLCEKLIPFVDEGGTSTLDS